MYNKVYLLQVRVKDANWDTVDYFSSNEAAQHCLSSHVSKFHLKYPSISFRVISYPLWSKRSYFNIVKLDSISHE